MIDVLPPGLYEAVITPKTAASVNPAGITGDWIAVLERYWREILEAVPSAIVVVGLSNVVFDWPLVAAVLHTGGAAALVVVLMWILTGAHPSRSTVLN